MDCLVTLLFVDVERVFECINVPDSEVTLELILVHLPNEMDEGRAQIR